MAAVPNTDTCTILVNDVELVVPKGELIVESVKRLGLEIPIFCYHPRMKPVGMCRMCLVEVGTKQPDGSVRKMPKPQAACTLPASEGLVIYTDTEMVHRDRRGVLEFLLINHPLDCPICDRGGECPLQNNTIFYGPSTSRYIEIKRHLPKAYPLSKYVTLDLERCIQCGRCVRFTEEISGDHQLAFRFRGASMQPSTFKLTDFESKFSGNVIEICPVGALTSARYRFRARPWDLETNPAQCTNCSMHCSIWFDHRSGRLVRVNGRTNEFVNEEWTCDKGKFGHDWYNSDKRLRSPLIRRGEQFVECSWGEAYDAILKAFSVGGNQVAGLVGGSVSNEGLYAFQKLFRKAFSSNNIDYRVSGWAQKADERLEAKMGVSQIQTPIAEYESAPGIVLFGTDLSDELPVLYLRVRKGWFQNGARVVVASSKPVDGEDFASLVLRYKEGTESILAEALARAAAGATDAELASASEKTNVPTSLIVQAAELAKQTQAPLVSTHALFNQPEPQATLEALARFCQSTGGQFNCYTRKGNNQGAEDMGVLPDLLPGLVPLGEGDAQALGYDVPPAAGLGTQGVLEGCINGGVQALWLVDTDPTQFAGSKGLEALENVPFLVYTGTLETEAMGYASVVLPLEAPAEQDGSYTNMERRVQRIRQVVPAPGDAKQGWRIFGETLLRAAPVRPWFNAGEIMDEIAGAVPGYEVARYSALPETGARVELTTKTPSAV